MIGVFGGSGFYEFLEGAEEIEVETPYGRPSAPLVVGDVSGARVAFLPRHGRNHEPPVHRVPYRANVWAMREVGVRRVIGPNACGALRADLELGEFVLCDQFVDRTSGREDAYCDGPEATHVSAADPYCADPPTHPAPDGATARRSHARPRDRGRDPGPALLDARRVSLVRVHGLGRGQHDGVPGGPSRARAGALLSMVTDYDVGVEGRERVDAAAVVRVFDENVDRLQALLLAALPRIGPQPDDDCANALRGARL